MDSKTANSQCPNCGAASSSESAYCVICLAKIGFASALDECTDSEWQSNRFKEFGDYTLRHQIGVGGMGVVYEAYQTSLHRLVALKMISETQVNSPAAVRRFTIGAEAAAQLDHPNIVSIYEIGEWDQQPFLSMRLVHGQSLRERIASGHFYLNRTKEGTNRSEVRAVQQDIARLMVTTARAVHHAHKHGVIHRDLKPGNILIDQNGAPHLTDFGLAKLMEIENGTSRKTDSLSGIIVGTPAYMSPEQAEARHVQESSDIYSLGVVLYEMLTGQPPFEGKTPMETLRKVCEEEPRRPRQCNPNIDPELETICLKCLEKEPSHRYASAELLAEDLTRWLQNKPIMVRPPTPLGRSWKWIKRNPIGASLITTFFFAFMAVSSLLYFNHKQASVIEMTNVRIIQDWIESAQRVWGTLETNPVILPSHISATIDKRKMRDVPPPNRLELGFIADAEDNPAVVAYDYAQWVGAVESDLSRILHSNMAIDIHLFRSSLPLPSIADFSRLKLYKLSLLSFLEFHRHLPLTIPILQESVQTELVLVVHQNSAVSNVTQLLSQPIALCTSYVGSFRWMQLQLLDQGFPFELVRPMHPVYSHTSKTKSHVPLVVEGKVQAALISGKVYAENRFQGLRSLLFMTNMPSLIVADSGLVTSQVILALKSAVTYANTQNIGAQTGDGPKEFVPVDEAAFETWTKNFHALQGEPDHISSK